MKKYNNLFLKWKHNQIFQLMKKNRFLKVKKHNHLFLNTGKKSLLLMLDIILCYAQKKF